MIRAATAIRAAASVGERTADALDAKQQFDGQRGRCESIVAGIAEDFAPVIASIEFVQVNRYPQTPNGSCAMEFSGVWCTAHATEAGLRFPTSEDGQPSKVFSMKRLGDLSRFGAVLCPLDPGGSTRPEFVPVLESNAWKGLLQVQSGKAVGVQCPSGGGDYPSGITQLSSLRTALEKLSS